MATLLLRLAGALQSWGTEAKFDERRTMNFPTKSGVIGMLAAAQGRSREDTLEDLNTLKFGVRIDQAGELLRDYHTAKGIQEKNAYITTRYYLADAVFLVGFESTDTDFLRQIENDLRNPAFPLFLGRRSCPPTQPLVCGIREADLLTALQQEPWLVADWRKQNVAQSERRLRILIDDENDGEAVLRDVPLSFSRNHRRFSWRNVAELNDIYMEPTKHDPMAELR